MNARKTTLTNLCRFLLAAVPWILPLVLIATILCPVSLEQWMESWSQFNDIATPLLDSMTTATINLIKQTVATFLSAFFRFSRVAIPCLIWAIRTTTNSIRRAAPVCLSAFLQFSRTAIRILVWTTMAAIKATQRTLSRALQRYTEPKITFLNQHATWSREEKTRFRSIVEQLSSVPAIRELIFK